MKAFDTVPHKRLLSKLPSYGISKEVINWIKGFLHGKQQKVLINGVQCEWGEVTSGIAQGDMLGPLLCVIYITDVPDVVESSMLLFTDDTQLYRQMNSNIHQFQLQEDVNNKDEWTTKIDPQI